MRKRPQDVFDVDFQGQIGQDIIAYLYFNGKKDGFFKYKFGLITVENNEEIRGTGEMMKKYMAERGYGVFLDLGGDIMFINYGRKGV